jgi:hypothetical protein
MRFVWERAVGLRREKKRWVGMYMCLKDGRRRFGDNRRTISAVESVDNFWYRWG